jgi:hypothetical protein
MTALFGFLLVCESGIYRVIQIIVGLSVANKSGTANSKIMVLKEYERLFL